MSYAVCNGERYQANYFNRFTGVCDYFLARWEGGQTEPIFRYNRDGDNIYTWTFRYTNGQECNGGDRIFDVVWKCDENGWPFSTNTQCQNNEDECYTEMIIPSQTACVKGVEPSESKSLDYLDFVMIGIGVAIFVLLVINGGLFYSRNRGKRVLLAKEIKSNEYNTMTDDNLEMTDRNENIDTIYCE